MRTFEPDSEPMTVMKRTCFTAVPVLAIALLAGCATAPMPPRAHPDVTGPQWQRLFAEDLSNAVDEAGVWSYQDGLLTAEEDVVLWTDRQYDDFILDLEFRNAEGTNSGVFIHASDLDDWVASSIEIQIADDYAEQWATAPPTWQAGAIFGHKPATTRTVRQPGEWNRYTITTQGDMVWVMLNGELVNEMDMSEWTSAERNPDGSEIPEWLSRPVAELPRHGHIGLQGKHAGAPIWFRNIRIRELNHR